MFGPHLIVDGSACNRRKLADRVFIEQVLNDFPGAIGMTRIGGPYIFDYQAPDPAYSGVSGFVIIAESHIAIHTFPELDYFTLDVFSCRNFDPDSAVDFIQQALEVKQMDRTILLRGLSFHGPHHGKFTLPVPVGAERQPQDTGHQEKEQADRRSNGSPWPTYGVTPDYGTYGIRAADELTHRSEQVANMPVEAAAATADVTPVLINPTASISGLLDSLTGSGGQARSLGRVVAGWEQMVQDSEMSIVLALSDPVIAQGLREVLVYAVEHHYVDVLILSAEDLFADLYESLGYVHYIPQSELLNAVPSHEGHQSAVRCFTSFVHELEPRTYMNSSDLWQQLGNYLSSSVPRKGILQAAAASGVQLFTPDLGTSTLGAALLAVRSRGIDACPPLDLTEDKIGLAQVLGRSPRLGIVRTGAGPADTLISQACEVAGSLMENTPVLYASVSLGTTRPVTDGERHIALSAGADLVLPIAVTALAQRIAYRQRHTAKAETGSREHCSTTANSS